MVPCAVLKLHFQHHPCTINDLLVGSSCPLLGGRIAQQTGNIASNLCREKQQILATPVKEQAVVLFLGERYYGESSLMDGRKTVAHPFVPSKCPPAVLVLLHWIKVTARVWKTDVDNMAKFALPF